MSGPVSPEAWATGEAVVRLPRTLAARSDVSAHAVVQGSGYFDRHADITPDLLRRILSSDAALVDDWLLLSQDKRTTSGWFFCREADGFTVGLVTEAGRRANETTYSDPIEACAEFIAKELEDMRVARGARRPAR